MKKYLLIGCIILIGMSLVSSYYTYTLEQRELLEGQSLSGEIQQIKTQVADVESLISQVEEKKSETEPLITEEQKLEHYEEIAAADPRVFITVNDPVVKAKVEEVTRLCTSMEEKQLAVFEYVRKEIEYVTEGNPKKWSYPQPYLQYKFDFWQFPRETIEWRKGDCEDQSILLCAMMRAAGVSASNVRVVVGIIYGEGGAGGHAWVEFKMGDTWYVLESTVSYLNYIEQSVYYNLFSPDVLGWFNDKEYYEEEIPEIGGSITFRPI
jgi:transglutaminase-like putative cysteine protease